MMIKKLMCFMFGHLDTKSLVVIPHVCAVPVERLVMLHKCVRCDHVHQEVIYDKNEINNRLGA